MVEYQAKFTVIPCAVCGQLVDVDNFGQGKCKNCGWHQDEMSLEYPDQVEYPNMVSFNKAKTLYKQGLPLKPSLDDFIAGLQYYTEMEFEYLGVLYGVIWTDCIQFGEYFEYDSTKWQYFDDFEEFKQKAHISGKLLKDIWADVTNANYMICR